MLGALRLVLDHRLCIALYVVLCAASGIGWAGIYLLIASDGLDRGLSTSTYFLFGSVSGLTVGLAMSWIYRAANPVHTIYSAPLALWIGMFSFLVQVLLAQDDNHQPAYRSIIAAAAYATIAMFTPLAFLILPAFINGWLLRWVLRHGIQKERKE